MIFTPYGTPEPGSAYLAPTAFLDYEHRLVRGFVDRVAGPETSPVRKAVRLFYAVRDEIRYDPFSIRLDPAAFEASTVLRHAAPCWPRTPQDPAGSRTDRSGSHRARRRTA